MEKNKILLIGNGFDLAHGMKTDYRSFVEFLFDEQRKAKSEFIDHSLFEPLEIFTKAGEVAKVLKSHSTLAEPAFHNIFYKLIFYDFERNDGWSDIEQLYLKTLLDRENDYSPHRLNKDFAIIKSYLEKYMAMQEAEHPDKKVNKLIEFFQCNTRSIYKIINFNYTKTVERYNGNKITYIHGRLFDKEQPIIFGNGPADDIYKNLRSYGNPFLSNIKNLLYSLNSELTKFLEDLDDLAVSNLKYETHLIGLSCGPSDTHILNKILRHDAISSIHLWHYKGRDGYQNVRPNLERILDSDEIIRKIKPYDVNLALPENGW